VVQWHRDEMDEHVSCHLFIYLFTPN